MKSVLALTEGEFGLPANGDFEKHTCHAIRAGLESVNLEQPPNLAVLVVYLIGVERYALARSAPIGHGYLGVRERRERLFQGPANKLLAIEAEDAVGCEVGINHDESIVRLEFVGEDTHGTGVPIAAEARPGRFQGTHGFDHRGNVADDG